MALATLGGLFPAVDTNAACGGDSLCQQLQQAQGQAGNTQAALTNIEGKITDVQAKMHALSALIAALDSEVANEQDQINRTEERMHQLDEQIQRTEGDLAQREAELKVREDIFGQRVRAMDKHGSVNYLALIVTASNFNQLLDRVVIMQQLIDSDHKLIEDMRAARAQVQALRDQLSGQRQQQANLLAEQQVLEQSLQARRHDQQAAYAYQASLEAQYQQQRQVLEAQQAAINSQIHNLRAAYQAELAAIAERQREQQLQQQQQQQQQGSGSSGGPAPSGFLWPQAAHFITQGFGCTDLMGEPYWPSCGTHHFHTGIDIAGPYGTPIYATAAGIVNDNPGSAGYGNYVIVIHQGGYASVYGHLASFAQPSGAYVAQGQVIGYEGSTGFSTGPHLHFEIRYNDAWQDPRAYVGC